MCNHCLMVSFDTLRSLKVQSHVSTNRFLKVRHRKMSVSQGVTLVSGCALFIVGSQLVGGLRNVPWSVAETGCQGIGGHLMSMQSDVRLANVYGAHCLQSTTVLAAPRRVVAKLAKLAKLPKINIFLRSESILKVRGAHCLLSTTQGT